MCLYIKLCYATIVPPVPSITPSLTGIPTTVPPTTIMVEPTDFATSQTDTDLTGGAIAGIVIGSVFAAIMVVTVIILAGIWYVHILHTC